MTGSSRRSFTLIDIALKRRQFALQAIDTVQKFLYAGILSRYADRDQAGEHHARCQNRCAWVFHPECHAADLPLKSKPSPAGDGFDFKGRSAA